MENVLYDLKSQIMLVLKTVSTYVDRFVLNQFLGFSSYLFTPYFMHKIQTISS